MSLLMLVQAVTDELGLPRPAAVQSSTDQTVRQMLALANREGKQLARRFPWEALAKETSFTTVAAEIQGTLLTIAPDFARFQNDTMYDRTRARSILGPLSAQEWQREKGAAATGMRDQFRVRGGKILFLPAPEAGRTVYFEYQSRNWCKNAAGSTEREAWAADTDLGILDEDLMALGLKWRFLKAKGLDYAEEFREYETRLYDARAQDGSKRRLEIGDGTQSAPAIGIPDSNWSL